MKRIDKVLKEQSLENNMINRGKLLFFKCPHNYPCFDYFKCEGIGLRENGEHDTCANCWLQEVEYCVLLGGKVFTDRIEKEFECEELIKEYVEEGYGDNSDFTFRLMTPMEMKEYD